MTLTLPDPPERYSSDTFRIWKRECEEALTNVLRSNEHVDLAQGSSVFLRSPNGSRFAVTVDNAGNLTATPAPPRI